MPSAREPQGTAPVAMEQEIETAFSPEPWTATAVRAVAIAPFGGAPING